ncbi:FlgO family outer membrane protein [Thiorhodospira sibirica]|uniref:FlgO family outer membrane protein n=1 Tax=Thiorhodospira sibirica TaxID=154347 RepID=UPI00022C0B20|nr:FlgO family outer membrane protein [Thiorhodospira sibirica]
MMKKPVLLVVLVAVVGLMLSGCEGLLPHRGEAQPQADIIASSYAAADALIHSGGNSLLPNYPLIGATFVDINDLERTTPFGRVVSEHFSSRFSERGFEVIEILLRTNVYVRQDEGGEFMLSRELRNLSEQRNAQAVIVGTYAIGRHQVYITARLIRAVDSRILASHDYTLPLDDDIGYLLRVR